VAFLEDTSSATWNAQQCMIAPDSFIGSGLLILKIRHNARSFSRQVVNNTAANHYVRDQAAPGKFAAVAGGVDTFKMDLRTPGGLLVDLAFHAPESRVLHSGDLNYFGRNGNDRTTPRSRNQRSEILPRCATKIPRKCILGWTGFDLPSGLISWR
jgi:hypothetical protein